MTNEDLMKQGDDFDLSGMKMMHMLHACEVTPGDLAVTVRLGFKWAEIGERAGMFLCECSDACTDPEICGRAFYENVQAENPVRITEGREVLVDFGFVQKDLVLSVWCCDNCEVVGTGAVEDLWVGRFHDLPARLLQWEHEVSSRSYAGLRESMKRAYGDRFGEASFVTVVVYRRIT